MTKRTKRADSGVMLERARRELDKGNFKDALKAAELAQREEDSPDALRTLVEAGVGRIRQLGLGGLAEQARGVLDRLLKLPHQLGPDLLIELRIAAGDRTVDASQVSPEMLERLTDEAIVREGQPPQVPQIVEQVAALREALSAIEAGDDERGAALLAAVPRSSPVAEWRLFCRGLSAHYRGERAKAEECWGRLNPLRPPARIAQVLSAGRDEADNLSALRELDRQLGDPLIFALAQVVKLYEEGTKQEGFRAVRDICRRFGASHPDLVSGLVEFCWKDAVARSDLDGIDLLAKLGVPPPAEDPKWRRAEALLLEQRPEGADPKSWRDYLRDVDQIAGGDSRRAKLIESLVLRHAAEVQREVADHIIRTRREMETLAHRMRRNHPEVLQEVEEYVERDECQLEQSLTDAVELLQAAIKARPDWPHPRHDLAKVYQLRFDFRGFERTLRELLAAAPDDFKAHCMLADHLLEFGEGAAARPHVEAAARLRPRDRTTQALGWRLEFDELSRLLSRKQIVEALQRLALIEQQGLAPRPGMNDVIRHLIAHAAGEDQEAEEAWRRASAAMGSDAVAAPRALECAARLGLPKVVLKRLEAEFAQEVGKEVAQGIGKEVDAGRLPFESTADALRDLDHRKALPHKKRMVKVFAKRIERELDRSWTEPEMRAVIGCLQSGGGYKRTIKWLIERGLHGFPRSPFFPYVAALEERNAHRRMQRMKEALSLSETGQHDEELVAEIHTEFKRAHVGWATQQMMRFGWVDEWEEDEND